MSWAIKYELALAVSSSSFQRLCICRQEQLLLGACTNPPTKAALANSTSRGLARCSLLCLRLSLNMRKKSRVQETGRSTLKVSDENNTVPYYYCTYTSHVVFNMILCIYTATRSLREWNADRSALESTLAMMEAVTGYEDSKTVLIENGLLNYFHVKPMRCKRARAVEGLGRVVLFISLMNLPCVCVCVYRQDSIRINPNWHLLIDFMSASSSASLLPLTHTRKFTNANAHTRTLLLSTA